MDTIINEKGNPLQVWECMNKFLNLIDKVRETRFKDMETKRLVSDQLLSWVKAFVLLGVKTPESHQLESLPRQTKKPETENTTAVTQVVNTSQVKNDDDVAQPITEYDSEANEEIKDSTASELEHLHSNGEVR